MSHSLSISLVIGATAITLALLVIAKRRMTGTTLVAVWAWAVVSVIAVAAVEVAVCFLGDAISLSNIQALRWTAACSTFCPMMAQLGAKRPQERGWQWIVLSLWVILALPIAQPLVLGRMFEVPMAWLGFACVLIAIGTLNMLPTRYGFSALAVGLAQATLLVAYQKQGNEWPAIAVALVAVAAIAAYRTARRERPARTPLDRVWFDFRDLFGAVWALRIGEQLNKSSEFQDWGVAVGWLGFTDSATGKPATDMPAETEAAIERSLRTMLRRFVPPEWLNARLPASATTAASTNRL